MIMPAKPKSNSHSKGFTLFDNIPNKPDETRDAEDLENTPRRESLKVKVRHGKNKKVITSVPILVTLLVHREMAVEQWLEENEIPYDSYKILKVKERPWRDG